MERVANDLDGTAPTWSLARVLEASGGAFIGQARPFQIGGFSIDSRTARPEDIFIALSGPHFNGHDFVGSAFQKGAVGAVVSEASYASGRWDPFLDQHFLVVVPDPQRSLQEMARWHRKTYPVPVVAVTGSNGKTTTKEMIAAILSVRGPILKSEGNQNNHIGLPLSLLRLSGSDHAAVVELGINKKGEMRRLCEIAAPTVGLITNIGPSHLEFLETMDGVAHEKGILFESVAESGMALVNRDDPYLAAWESRLPRKVTYAMNRPADISAEGIDQQGGETTFMLHLPGRGDPRASVGLATFGRHQVMNALAAAAVAHALGFTLDEMVRGLKRFRPVDLRAQRLSSHGVDILLDAYNANLASMRAALEMLMAFRPNREKGVSCRKIALLGDMFELGEAAPASHLTLGGLVATCGVEGLIAVGTWAGTMAEGARQQGLSAEAIVICQDMEEAIASLPGLIRKGDCLLIKGSRGMKMERLLPVLGLEA